VELERAGEDDDAFRAHASHYLALAERLAADDRGPNVLRVRDEIERELGNLRQVLTWTLGAPGDGSVAPAERGVLGLRMCAALSWFWYTSGYVAEGREWAERASAVASGEQGEELATVLHTLGILTMQQGQNRTGRDIIAKSLRIWRRLGRQEKIALELNSMGVAYRSLGDRETARRLFEESLQAGLAAGNSGRVATAVSNLGLLDLDEGRVEQAIERFAEAEEADRKRGDVWGIAADWVNRAGAFVAGGRSDEAMALLRSHAAEVAALGDTDMTINVIELFALCHAAAGDAPGAARLAGAAEALREQASLPPSEPDQVFLERHLADSRAAMSAADWRAEREAGRTLALDEALALAQATP
jgi:tetratricopeptide (TPR) repeat protein